MSFHSKLLCVAAWMVLMAGCASPQGIPRAVVKNAPPYRLPGVPVKDGATDMDCNCPAHWDGDRMYIFYSCDHPFRSAGADLFHQSRPSDRTEYDNAVTWKDGGRWIESTCRAEDGLLYGWYHNEPHPMCGKEHWTAPRIGAVVSSDNGMHWKDLGIVLTVPSDSLNCESQNYYFCGGNGDFCVNLDNDGKYLYFFISTYNKDVREQGVAVARMAYADRNAPVGRVMKWYQGRWSEPGLGGHVTPIYTPKIDWHSENCDVLWGPSVHWNTHIQQWVMLLNRAKDKDWSQEGIYVSFSPDLSQPRQWSEPKKILDGDMKTVHWYPQVIGMNASARETDKRADRVARLFVKGTSNWEIVFLKAGEAE